MKSLKLIKFIVSLCFLFTMNMAKASLVFTQYMPVNSSEITHINNCDNNLLQYRNAEYSFALDNTGSSTEIINASFTHHCLVQPTVTVTNYGPQNNPTPVEVTWNGLTPIFEGDIPAGNGIVINISYRIQDADDGHQYYLAASPFLSGTGNAGERGAYTTTSYIPGGTVSPNIYSGADYNLPYGGVYSRIKADFIVNGTTYAFPDHICYVGADYREIYYPGIMDFTADVSPAGNKILINVQPPSAGYFQDAYHGGGGHSFGFSLNNINTYPIQNNGPTNAIVYPDNTGQSELMPPSLYASTWETYIPGTYTIERKAFDFCWNTYSYTQTVTIDCTPPVLTLPTSTAACTNSTLTLAVSSTGANPATSYTWAPATRLSNANIANPTFTSTTAGTYSYTVTGTNACGMSSTQNVAVTVAAAPPAFAIAPSSVLICGGNTSANVGVAPGTGYTYSWTYPSGAIAPNPGTINNSYTTFTAPNTLTANTTYTYTLTRRNAAGCSTSATRAVIFRPNLANYNPVITTTPLSGSVCEGQTISIAFNSSNITNYGVSLIKWYRDLPNPIPSTLPTAIQTGGGSVVLSASTQLAASMGSHSYYVSLNNTCSSVMSPAKIAEIKPAPIPTINSTTDIPGTRTGNTIYKFKYSMINHPLTPNALTASATQPVSTWQWQTSAISPTSGWGAPLTFLVTTNNCMNIQDMRYYRVTANYTNGCSKTSISTATQYHKVTIDYNQRLANVGSLEIQKLQVFPNPFANTLHLKYHYDGEKLPEIKLYDINGQNIDLESSISTNTQDAGNYETVWNTQELPQGIYILNVKLGEDLLVEKIIKE